MKSTAPLTGSHLRTYTAIFQQPSADSLSWLDVHALFRHLGDVEVDPNSSLTVTRNGEVLVLHPPRTKEVADADDLMALRHFLERSEKGVRAPAVNTAAWLVVIDHREARIYRSLAPGAVAQQMRPHVPEDFFRHAPDSGRMPAGKDIPELIRFFEPVAAALCGAPKILLFGSGTGKGGEMEQFSAWLQEHRPKVARRVVGSIVIDESHLTEAQLLAKARDYCASNPAASLSLDS